MGEAAEVFGFFKNSQTFFNIFGNIDFAFCHNY